MAEPAPIPTIRPTEVKLSAGQSDAPPVLADRDAVRAARRIIAAWPGYAPTPLLRFAALAARLGVGGIWYKQEAERFGIGSFKALGAGHALFQALRRRIAEATGETIGIEDLLDGRHRALIGEVTAICATDGNHGRALAWSAAQFGCRAVIYVHRGVSPARRAAIAGHGAEVVEIGDTYDEAVRRAGEDAARRGWLLIADTAHPGYTEVPTHVVQGYAVLLDEAVEALPAEIRISHLFVQAGVGGMAAAVLDTAPLHAATRDARGIVVEPDRAACLLASAERDTLTAVEGALDTIMAGLACGLPSLIAWPVLARRAAAFLSIADQAAIETMRLLATGGGDGTPVVAGESAVAGLAGLLAVAGDPELRETLALGPDSQILLFGTEGATDPELYTRYVGATPEAVLAGALRQEDART